MIYTVLNPSAARSREPSDGFPAGRAAERRPGGFASLLSGAVTSAGPRSRQAANASSAAPLASGADEGPADRTADEAGTWAAARSAGIDGASPLGTTAALLGGGLGAAPSPGSAVARSSAGVESAGTPPTGALSGSSFSAPPAQAAASGGGEHPTGRAALGIVPPPSAGDGRGPGGSGAAGSAADRGPVVAERVAPASAPGAPWPDPVLPTTPGCLVDHGLPGVGEGPRQPGDDPGSPSPENPPLAVPAPTAITPSAVGGPGLGAVPEAPPVDGELVPEAGTGGVNGPGAAAEPQPEGAIDAADAIPRPALHSELTAADRVPLQGTSDVPGPAPAGGRLAERVAEAVERLRLAPPPRSVVLDLGDAGGMKLSISLRGQAVHVTVLTPAGVGQPPSADWSRDLAAALAARGFELAGSGEGETGERAGRERPRDRPNRPAAAATATNPRPRRGRREAADGWRL